MGDRGTKPSSSMISRPRWNSFRCRLSRRLSSRASSGPLYLVFTDGLPSRCTSPTWRCWTTGSGAWSRSPEGQPGPAPAGGPGWKQPCLRPRLGIPPMS